jgi:hypothetical protein
MLSTIISAILIFIVSYEIFKGNLGLSIVIAAIILIDYQMWVRGGSGILFTDRTQIEKDLREIQKLEIAKKLKQMKE